MCVGGRSASVSYVGVIFFFFLRHLGAEAPSLCCLLTLFLRLCGCRVWAERVADVSFTQIPQVQSFGIKRSLKKKGR